MRHSTPMPGERAPDLEVETLSGKGIKLASEKPDKLSVVFFYRGVHCPVCHGQLKELNTKRQAFADAGISVHAVSMDSRERAERQRSEWEIGDLEIGYGLSEASAREWGLFISAREKDAEPDRFCEPGIAVVDRDGTLFALYLQNVPFARPALDGLLQGLNFVIEKNYPIRGKVAA